MVGGKAEMLKLVDRWVHRFQGCLGRFQSATGPVQVKSDVGKSPTVTRGLNELLRDDTDPAAVAAHSVGEENNPPSSLSSSSSGDSSVVLYNHNQSLSESQLRSSRPSHT